MDSVSHGDLVIRDRRPLLPFLTTALAVGIFAIDWFTPLGVAVWVLYVVPVAVTVVGHMPAVPLYVATASTAAMVFTFLTDDRGQFLANRDIGQFDGYPEPSMTIGEAVLAGTPRPPGGVKTHAT